MSETRMGRPRSESTRKAILQAISELVTEVGYANVTIEAIAGRAGAGKQTVYRWWSSKALILADAVVEGFLKFPSLHISDSGRLGADLKEWITTATASLGDPAARQMVRALATAASDDEQEALRLYEHSTGPQHQALIARLESGQKAGQLSSSVAPAAVADALMGTVLFRLLAGLPIPPTLSGIVDAFVNDPHDIAPTGAPPPPRSTPPRAR